MGLKRLYRTIEDTVVLEVNRLLHGEPSEDKELLKYYRLAYIFANGDIDLPELYFFDGKYCFKRHSKYPLPYTSIREVHHRELKRMAKNLIKRRFDDNVIINLDKKLYDLLYSTLTYEEAITLGEWGLPCADAEVEEVV